MTKSHLGVKPSDSEEQVTSKSIVTHETVSSLVGEGGKGRGYSTVC